MGTCVRLASSQGRS